jgi:hypothetical protein
MAKKKYFIVLGIRIRRIRIFLVLLDPNSDPLAPDRHQNVTDRHQNVTDRHQNVSDPQHWYIISKQN